MEFIAANRAYGVEPLTNHVAYNTSSMPSLPSFTTLASRLVFILVRANVYYGNRKLKKKVNIFLKIVFTL